MFRWDPERYRQFERQRSQPARDLLARVEHDTVRRVVDVGCGPGNSTELLARRFVGAEVMGFDSSAAMIQQARERLPGLAFDHADVLDWLEADAHRGAWDVVFSNAALHWLDDHARLLPRLVGCVRRGGVLAIQMPRNYGAPTHGCLREVASREPWASRLADLRSRYPVHEPGVYHDILWPHVRNVDVWETVYHHAFDDVEAVVDWMQGTALRPYLQRLDEREQAQFEEAYRKAVTGAYPARNTGQVLMAYRRVFVLAST